jgi:prephenate dehydratase
MPHRAETPGRQRFAYLGPAGTFTEAALLQLATPEEADFVPQPDVVSAIEAVRAGDADFAVVAIESTAEGGVTATLDALAVGEPLVLLREMLVPVSFTLVGPPGSRLEDVRRISAHPHAWVQCRRWLAAHLPGVVQVPATSNTAPAALLAERAALLAAGDPDVPAPGFDAALVPPGAVETYGLLPLAEGVEDNPHAVTRFVLVGRPGFLPERVAAALMGLYRVCPVVRFLGSYPRVDGVVTAVRPGTSDADFIAARSWVEALRSGRHPTHPD